MCVPRPPVPVRARAFTCIPGVPVCVHCFAVACGRIGPTSGWTSLTACKQSQAWVSLTNLLILWISTQSCDNDTSWADLARHTAGGRDGKAIYSCKDEGGAGLWLLIPPPLPPPPTKKKREGEIYPSPSLCSSLYPSLLRCLVSWCVDMDVWICYRRIWHNGLALLLS